MEPKSSTHRRVGLSAWSVLFVVIVLCGAQAEASIFSRVAVAPKAPAVPAAAAPTVVTPPKAAPAPVVTAAPPKTTAPVTPKAAPAPVVAAKPPAVAATPPVVAKAPTVATPPVVAKAPTVATPPVAAKAPTVATPPVAAKAPVVAPVSAPVVAKAPTKAPTLAPKPAVVAPTKAPTAAVPTTAPATAPAATGPAPAAGPTTALAPSSAAALDPTQVKALNALGITATSSACTTLPTTVLSCDANAKSQHLVTLNVQDCPATATLSAASLTALSTDLTELSFLNCPLADPLPDPSAAMVTNLASFTVTGPPEVYGWWMGRLTALTTLQVRDTLVNASSLDVITSNLVNLATLTISNASLGGIFPATWPAPTKLTALDLSNNQLYGPIPASIAKMTKLTTLDLSGNNFNDHIVTAIGDMASLTSLDLSHNALRMGIPKKLQNLHYLTKLDLSFNQLNGTIPDELSYLPLTYLDLSNNTLTGAVPFSDLFLSKLKVANFGGNVDLCYNSTITSAKAAAAVGLPLCGASLAPTPGPAYYPIMAPAAAPLAGASPSTKKKPKVVVIVFATLGALVGLAAVIYFCCRYWGAKAGYQ